MQNYWCMWRCFHATTVTRQWWLTTARTTCPIISLKWEQPVRQLVRRAESSVPQRRDARRFRNRRNWRSCSWRLRTRISVCLLRWFFIKDFFISHSCELYLCHPVLSQFLFSLYVSILLTGKCRWVARVGVFTGQLSRADVVCCWCRRPWDDWAEAAADGDRDSNVAHSRSNGSCSAESGSSHRWHCWPHGLSVCRELSQTDVFIQWIDWNLVSQ